MPGKLGTCPTCKGKVSTGAKSCPHCGERYFEERVVNEKDSIIDICSDCKGTGRVWNEEYAIPFLNKECYDCKGTGYRKSIPVDLVDLRTGYKKPQRPNYGYAARPESAGCFSIILIALSLAASLLIAIGL